MAHEQRKKRTEVGSARTADAEPAGNPGEEWAEVTVLREKKVAALDARGPLPSPGCSSSYTCVPGASWFIPSRDGWVPPEQGGPSPAEE